MTTQTFATVYLPKLQVHAWFSGWYTKYEAWRILRLTIRQLRSLDAHLLEDANVDAQALFGSHPPFVRRRPAPEPTFRFDFGQVPSDFPENGANCTG